MQSAIHEGYEYQDYFSVSIILQLIIQQTDAEIVIDRKNFYGDKFDDLKVLKPDGSTEFQIKYSDNERSHALTKNDFSNGNGHDTALSDLFFSWRKNKREGNDAKIKLCLAWSKPEEDDKIIKYLKPIKDQSMPFPSVAYKFDGVLFWPEGKKPQNTWRKFNSEIQEGHIDRNEFISFCDELTIFIEMPKASLNIQNPGEIECVIIRQVEKLGIGIYPNNNLTVENVVNKLATEVKRSRAMGNRLKTKTLIGQLGIIMNYGKFDQRFPVDATHEIILYDEIEKLYGTIQECSTVVLSGNPGSGKSWLVSELINKLKNEGKRIIHYNCFQSLQDTLNLERIRVTSLYGNLVSQIIEQFPELIEHKNTLFGADKAELENLFKFIEGEFYIIVDGLDHISREYELNKDEIARSETDIISELIGIDFPSNCYVLVSSQPIDEIEKFKGKNFNVFYIEPWALEQVKSLMAKYQIEDVILDCDNNTHVSEYLLKKSQGNALYLSYILRQIQEKEVNKVIIDEIPDYDINLSNYYTYLYTKVRSTSTVFALCGADFYLSQNDLMEITGIGELVEQDISLLHPLLIENTLCGGISIYHESFRRFVLSCLEDKKVNIERNVYGIIADWLQQKPFYKFDKAFYFLPGLLYKVKRDNDNIALIETEFVLQAVGDGYSRKYIRMNLNYMIRSAGRARNIIALAKASELLAMLDDLNEFESTGEEYFKAICDIKGAAKLNQLMQIDGKPTFDHNTGLLACYISSKAGVTPWWELYLKPDTEECNLENIKYYIRFHLDKRGIGIIPRIMKALEDEELSIRDECIEIAYGELIDYIKFEEIISIAEEYKLPHWKNYLLYIQTGYLTNDSLSAEVVHTDFEKIKALETVGENDVRIIKEFFSQVYHLAEQKEYEVINKIITECDNINWFYNWIIYCIKITLLSVQDATNPNIQIEGESVLKIMRLLLLDTEVFKGKPRTCDLYFLQHELTSSYERAIQLLLKNGTLQDLEQAFIILERLDDETGTSIDHYMGGPLPDSDFLEIISHFLTADNYDILKPFLVRTQGKIEKNEVYDCIAAAKLRFVSLISKYDYSDAADYFEVCIRYLVAYGFHKDMIIEQILDSYNTFYELVSENPEEERDTITKMTFALFNHTDGRETKHFLNSWFEKLLETDPKYALSFLSGYHLQQGRSWIVQHMIRSVIEKYCNDVQYSAITIKLIESLPNETSPRLIDAATKVFNALVKSAIELDGDEALIIKNQMNELVVNIVSRFNIIDESWPDNDSWKDGSIKDFLLSVKAAGFDVSQYLEYFHIHDGDVEPTQKKEKKFVDDKEKRRRFDASTLQDAIKWFESYDLSDQDLPDICCFLTKMQDDRNTLLEFLRIIIRKISGWNYREEKKNVVLHLMEQLNFDKEEIAEAHMLLFLGSYEWGSSLIDKNEFLKSIELDSEVAFDILYRELPEIVISHSGRITKGLINALYASKYNEESIVMIWENAFSVMKLRFPNLDQYSFDFVCEECEELVGLRNSMLTRFVDGGKEQFLAVYAYLADKAQEKNYTEFTEAVDFCLKQFKCFNLVTQLAIADLICRYSFQLPNVCQKRLILTIDSIYPTGNLLLDVMFSVFTVYKSDISKSLDKHVPDYMDQDDIEFYLAEKKYDLGKIKQKDISDLYAKNSRYRDPIMVIVSQCGIDYEALYVKLHSSQNLNDEIREFIAGSINLPEMNTVYKSYVIQYALHAIIEKAFMEKLPEIIPQSLLQLVPDFLGMYRAFRSREIAPRDHLFEAQDLQRDIVVEDAEYMRIASIEIRRTIDYKETKYIFSYMGVVPKSFDITELPVNLYIVPSFEKRKIYRKTDDSLALIELDSSLDKELEDNHFLWPVENICKTLNLHTEFDSLNGRYVALNHNQEVVFFMKNFQSCYRGDSDYPGYAIPLYVGTALYMKTNYLSLLKEHYGDLQIQIKTERMTQSY